MSANSVPALCNMFRLVANRPVAASWCVLKKQCLMPRISNRYQQTTHNFMCHDENGLAQVSTSLTVSKRMYAKKTIVKEVKRKGAKPRVILTEDEMMEVIRVDVLQVQLQSVVNKLKADFIQQVSLRSAAGNIETLTVKIDNENYPLNELAQVARKNPSLVAINMTGFPDGIKPVLQAIEESGMNLNPQQDGTMIYIPIPKVTREYRENLSKNAKMLFNKAKDDLRNIQNRSLKEVKSKTTFSEDLLFQVQEQVRHFETWHIQMHEFGLPFIGSLGMFFNIYLCNHCNSGHVSFAQEALSCDCFFAGKIYGRPMYCRM